MRSPCPSRPRPASDVDRFVVNGYESAESALLPEIRRQVEAEFAERLSAAGLFRRWILRRQIRAEISRRLDQQAPPDGLY